jgi:hypothetical protein
MAGVAPMMRSSSSTRQPPVLYERRRLPVPPSMRRNRSPPNRVYDAGAVELQATPSPSTSPPVLPLINPAEPFARPSTSQGFNRSDVGMHPRSNTISSQMPTRPPELAQFEWNQRVRRSMSLSSVNPQAFRNPQDPLSMHPVIPEVPSRATSPLHLGPGLRRSSLTSPIRPSMVPRQSSNGFWNDGEPEKPRQLMVRNPSPPPAEKNRKQLGEMVRRIGSVRQGDHHKVEDAAKNF